MPMMHVMFWRTFLLVIDIAKKKNFISCVVMAIKLWVESNFLTEIFIALLLL